VVNPILNHVDFLSGTMLLVDKPAHWTSFDVVNKIRYLLRKRYQLKKIKVGHAGTLDPLATGLLIICTGKWTKKISEYQDQHKKYEGMMILGGRTASYDAETGIEESFSIDHINQETIYNNVSQFIGKTEQYPPMYSAIKYDGVPLYKRARKGQAVELKKRPVEIFNFRITGIELPKVNFNVHCSKGTYIRSLVHDFGISLHNGAYLKTLRRTAIGPYSVDDAWSMSSLIEELEKPVSIL
jgi:tRNA pseudouridine55 synthase